MIVEHLLRNRKVLVIGISELDIIWNLEVEIENFRLVFKEAIYYYLSRLESILTSP